MKSNLWMGCAIAVFLPWNAGAFELDLPVRMNDVGYRMFGVAPFGYHVAEHRHDGHPGLDFEYLPGAKVYAAIGGSVQVFTDSNTPDRQTLQINFSENGRNYRLVHTNLSALEPGVVNGGTVTRAQALGTAGSQTQVQAGGVPVTYAMTHFQLDDFSFSHGLTNTSAVSPVSYFTAAAQADLAAIWSRSAYRQMVCEPYLSNPRGLLSKPTVIRTWTRINGTLANRIDFRCDFGDNEITGYTFYDASGRVLETGTAVITPVTAGTSAVDLTGAGGTRRGVLFAKDTVLRIAYAAPGGSRPADFSAASGYATGGPATNCAFGTDAVCFAGERSPYRPGDTLEADVALDWSKLTRSRDAADLWVALQLPAGGVLFLDGAGNWSAAASVHRTGVSGSTERVTVIAPFPVTAALAGTYTLYAVLMESGSTLGQLESARLSNIASGVFYLVGQ
jgi:hypothetical protein